MGGIGIMDLSTELLKMLEARSHPRFVKVVVWTGGLGVIAGGLLLVGRLGAAIFSFIVNAIAWAQSPGWDKAFPVVRDIGTVALAVLAAWVLMRIFDRFALLPNLDKAVKKGHQFADYLLALTQETLRMRAEFEAALQRAKEAGINVNNIVLPEWNPPKFPPA
jgi:hypothetical protein